MSELSPKQTPAATKPKVFISYSWTSQDHTDRILAWCERLVADGVDVEIDRWSLNEGHDKFAFMERMVADPTITNVLIFSDRRYAEKANGRASGVGTESQIISAEIYGRTTQERFLPIVCEFEPDGEPCVPIFLKGRIYFNFSTPEAANDNWEKLLRRLYSKPALTKPRLGSMPAYLVEGSAPASVTAAKFLSLKDAFQRGRPNLRVWISDYLDAVNQQLEEFRVTTRNSSAEDAAKQIHSSLEAMLPLRNELIEFLTLVIGSFPPAESTEPIGDLLERLLQFRYPPSTEGSHSEWWFDHYAFFSYEMFIYAVSAHIRLRQYDGLVALFGRRFLIPETARGRVRAHDFSVFRSYSRLLGSLNERSSQPRLSIEADLIKTRASLSSYPMAALMQADLLCALRVVTNPREYSLWSPVTCVYAEYMGTLDLFLRAEEKRVFRQLAPVIGVADKQDLESKLATWQTENGNRFSWLFRWGDLSLEGLIGLEGLDTKGA